MKTELQIDIDSDEGLKGKKRVLTITALVLLVIQFTGATIIEANTFILKLNFTHHNGLALLLFLSIIFLLVRYYSYARKYHEALNKLWSLDLMENPKIDYSDERSGDVYGWLHESYPPNFDPIECRREENCSFRISYKSSWFFIKQFQFDIANQHQSYSTYTNIYKKLGLKKYLIIFVMEIRYRILGYFKYRENLDIFAPYILSFIAIMSFVYPNELEQLMSYITP